MFAAKHQLNPIIQPHQTLDWASKKLYNAAVVFDHENDKKFHMLLRAVGNEGISRLGYAESIDGIKWEINNSPVFVPMESYETHGCEDPRITKIDDSYYLLYTAYDGTCARLALAKSKDLRSWQRIGLVLPKWKRDKRQQHLAGRNNWSKAGSLFPEKINGKFWMLFGDNEIWGASATTVDKWNAKKTPIMSARKGYFDEAYIEMGPPPIKTEHGWLIFYHGVNRHDEEEGDVRIYRLGAALLDLNNPEKVLWRSKVPILEPEKDYETIGYIDIFQGMVNQLNSLTEKDLKKLAEAKKLPQAIFCCGVVQKDNIFNIYYAAADTVICLATISLEQILSS